MYLLSLLVATKDGVFVSSRAAGALGQDGFKQILKSGGLLAAETGKYLAPLSPAQREEFRRKVVEMACTGNSSQGAEDKTDPTDATGNTDASARGSLGLVLEAIEGGKGGNKLDCPLVPRRRRDDSDKEPDVLFFRR